MARLIKKLPDHDKLLFERVIFAHTLLRRFKGLLGTTTLPENETMWIRPCNNIHTFHMKYAIDAVFVSRNLKICSIHREIEPGRFLLPVWKAHSVFEMKAGRAEKLQLQQGDQLYVDP